MHVALVGSSGMVGLSGSSEVVAERPEGCMPWFESGFGHAIGAAGATLAMLWGRFLRLHYPIGLDSCSITWQAMHALLSHSSIFVPSLRRSHSVV